MISLQNLLISILITLFTGGFIGWKIGSADVTKYKAQIELIQTQASLAKDRFEKDKAELERKTLEVQAEAKTKIEAVQSSLRNYEATSAQLSARKDTEIKTLKSLISKGKLEIAELESAVNSADSSAERTALEAEVTRLKTLLQNQENRAKGLECLTVPVPEEYLNNLNSI